jgi:Uma2 family endonuclease
VRGKNDIHLSNDPPPDLVIEVDVTSPSLNKLPIYAAIGIAEIWIYKGKNVEFLKLVGEDYRKINQSIALPMLSDEKATEFLENGLIESSTKWIKKIREWSKDK